jgi:hypothetical protein
MGELFKMYKVDRTRRAETISAVRKASSPARRMVADSSPGRLGYFMRPVKGGLFFQVGRAARYWDKRPVAPLRARSANKL